MADVCSVLGGAGRKILNLIRGIKIEIALQHRSHCTPPHSSREHDERPVPKYILPTNLDKTQACVGLVGPLRQEPAANGDPRASADPADLLRRRVATEKSPQRQRTPQTLHDAERALKSAPKRAWTLRTPLQTDVTRKEVHLLHEFWGNSHHMPSHHPKSTCQP